MIKGRHIDGVDGDFHVLATFAQSRGVVTITQLTDTRNDDDSFKSSSTSPCAGSQDKFSLIPIFYLIQISSFGGVFILQNC